MKKIIAAALMLGMILTGCKSQSSMSYTFKVETGDSVKVTLDTSGSEYKLTQSDGTFAVEEEETAVLQGVFLTEDMYDQYKAAAETAGAIVETGDNGFILYEYEGAAGVEHNILTMISDSDTGVIIASLEENDKVKEAYSKLKFEVE